MIITIRISPRMAGDKDVIYAKTKGGKEFPINNDAVVWNDALSEENEIMADEYFKY